jgi:hypothetical protein
MAEPVSERAWTCLGCGERWPEGAVAEPDFGDHCECGDERWVLRVVGGRSKAGNAARLEAMAAEAQEERARSERWGSYAELAAALNSATLECDRQRDDFLACRAECERLRVIVDAAIKAHDRRFGSQSSSWRFEVAVTELWAAVEAEVTRRG